AADSGVPWPATVQPPAIINRGSRGSQAGKRTVSRSGRDPVNGSVNPRGNTLAPFLPRIAGRCDGSQPGEAGPDPLVVDTVGRPGRVGPVDLHGLLLEGEGLFLQQQVVLLLLLGSQLRGPLRGHQVPGQLVVELRRLEGG